jgi:hypothetical protein
MVSFIISYGIFCVASQCHLLGMLHISSREASVEGRWSDNGPLADGGQEWFSKMSMPP